MKQEPDIDQISHVKAACIAMLIMFSPPILEWLVNTIVDNLLN